jgi:ElaB/YqjD/DUF883 family membrane-anchored ribosome-binding protein
MSEPNNRNVKDILSEIRDKVDELFDVLKDKASNSEEDFQNVSNTITSKIKDIEAELKEIKIEHQGTLDNLHEKMGEVTSELTEAFEKAFKKKV